MGFEIREMNPYIRVATQSVLRAGHEIGRRVLFDYEMIYVESGCFTLMYDGRDYFCCEGQFLLLRPGIPHAFFGLTGEVSQPHIHFDFTATAESPRIPISFRDVDCFSEAERRMIARDVFEECPQQPVVDFAEREDALRLFYGVIQAQKNAPLLAKATLSMLLTHMIEKGFSQCLCAEEGKLDLARQVKDYLDAGHGFEARLEDFEKMFSYSRYHLERLFRQRYGIGVIAYRNQKRMERARELLWSASVTEVAERLGFSSIYVFSRAYRRHFGESPREARNAEKL
ncbi:MAG: helix-turn-helix domain-containing protein [Clostridia bacterium]|nr:helix-turn-helix domain-containing protein [Clostridia bacterium]